MREYSDEEEQMLENIVKNTIRFRIDPGRAKSLVEELSQLEIELGLSFAKKYPTLYPLKDWLALLLKVYEVEKKRGDNL